MATNTHMEHIEEMIFNEGVDGARNAIFFIKDLRDMLAGYTDTEGKLTLKWDGAPAVIIGEDPEDKQFFVAKKSLFNKDPILYKSVKDIKSDKKLAGTLKKKFAIVFNEYSKMGIKGIYQGDLMFTKSDIKVKDIHGEKCFTFHPNTIMYAVPVKSGIGSDIAKAKVGITWHTTYTGSSIKGLKASFGKHIGSKFKKNASTWDEDAQMEDVTSKANFTKSETKELDKLISQMGKTLQMIPGETLSQLRSDAEISKLIKIFNNKYVKAGTPFPNPAKHVSDLYHYIQDYYQTEIDKRTTESAKAKQQEKLDEVNKIFANPMPLVNVFKWMNYCVDAKHMIIDKLNDATAMATFVKTTNGLKATGHEGFVAIDQSKGAIKLVDRLEFSKNNFSPDILKGWG